MEQFKTIEELLKKIDNDSKRDDINHVRFISVNNFADYISLNKQIFSKCSQICMSKKCIVPDRLPMLDEVYREIASVSQNAILLPLSEHLRVDNKNVQGVLRNVITSQLKETSENKKIRVYVPIYRMKEALIELIDSDPRIGRLVYFLDSDGKYDEYSLTIISPSYDVEIRDGKKIDSYKSYLEYWEDNPSQPIVLSSTTASGFKKNQYIDNVKVYTRAYEILTHQNLIDASLPEGNAPEEVWNELLKNSKGKSSIIDILQDKLKTDKAEFCAIYTKQADFFDNNSIFRWLLLKALTHIGYLRFVLENTANQYELFEKIVNSILEIEVDSKIFSQYFYERKEILASLKIVELPASFWNELNKIKESKKLYYLSDNTRKEKEKILELISKQSSINLDLLQKRYPYLYYYVRQCELDNEELDSYFNQYKSQKIRNEIDESFIDLVDDYAKEAGKWLKFGLSNRNDIIEKRAEKDGVIAWLDGLGIEYNSFIKGYLLNKYPHLYVCFDMAYANMPTITDDNKDFRLKRTVILENRKLDKLKHVTDFPFSLPEELDIIAQQLDEIALKANDFDRILIVSDHGFTRLFKLAKRGSLKASDTAKIERFGRYCYDSKIYNKIDGYSNCIDEGSLHIFANYDRFTVSMNLQGEIHGGATLEEILVPIITISRKKIVDEVIFTSTQTKYLAKAGERIEMQFKSNKIIDCDIYINGKKCIYDVVNKVWTIKLEVNAVGRISLFIKDSRQNILGKIEPTIEIKKGITSNSDF